MFLKYLLKNLEQGGKSPYICIVKAVNNQAL